MRNCKLTIRSPGVGCRPEMYVFMALFRVALILRYLLKGTQPFGRPTQYRPGAKNVRIGEKVDLNNVHLVRHGIVMLVRTTRLVCPLPPD